MLLNRARGIRRAVVHLLRAVGDVGLPHEGDGLRVLDRGECFQGRAALRLRLESKPQISFRRVHVFAHVQRRSPRQGVKQRIQGVRLRCQDCFAPAEIAAARQLALLSKIFHQRIDG